MRTERWQSGNSICTSNTDRAHHGDSIPTPLFFAELDAEDEVSTWKPREDNAESNNDKAASQYSSAGEECPSTGIREQERLASPPDVEALE